MVFYLFVIKGETKGALFRPLFRLFALLSKRSLMFDFCAAPGDVSPLGDQPGMIKKGTTLADGANFLTNSLQFRELLVDCCLTTGSLGHGVAKTNAFVDDQLDVTSESDANARNRISIEIVSIDPFVIDLRTT